MAYVSGVWVPDSTVRTRAQERERHEAELLGMLQTSQVCREWNGILGQIDPKLELVWAPESAKAAGLTPGRFHVLRHNPGAPPSLIAVTGPAGEFVMPDSGLLASLEKADLWSDQAVRDRKRAQRELEVQKQRRQDREREDRIEEFADRWKARTNLGVSFANQGEGWSYRAGAKRAA